MSSISILKLLIVLSSSSLTHSYSIVHRWRTFQSRPLGTSMSNTLVLMSSSFTNESNSNDPKRSQSRIAGNQRAPSPQDIAIIDEMINKLSNAKAYDLPNAVSQAIRVVSSPRFFMRIAERADMTKDTLEKERLSALATNLVSTLEAVVSTTEDRLDERAKSLEQIVKAAAEPETGEFLVPLTQERITAMRERLTKIHPADLDEGFLAVVDKWMNKAHLDGLQGMVTILQKVLQMYAGACISRARAQLQANVGAAVAGQSQAEANQALAQQEAKGQSLSSQLMDRLMNMDSDLWDAELSKALTGGVEESRISPKAFMGEVQRTVEAIILGLPNGSMAQQVQAEFLRELIARIERIEK